MSNKQAKRVVAPMPSWTDAYREFIKIVDVVLSTPARQNHDEARKLINEQVDDLYAQHKGELAWDIAYTKWIEPVDDDEEV